VPSIGVEHTEHARPAGVRRIVYLSSHTVIGNPVPAMGRWHHERES
jgi:nucleoside-diphosphate-sugar epimerase